MNHCLIKRTLHKHLLYVMPVILMLLITSVFSNVVAADNLVNEVMQQRTVRGTVVDSQGESLIGVTYAKLDNPTAALADVNAIRSRAGLSGNQLMTQANMTERGYPTDPRIPHQLSGDEMLINQGVLPNPR